MLWWVFWGIGDGVEGPGKLAALPVAKGNRR